MRSIGAKKYSAIWALGAAALGCGAEAGEPEALGSLARELRCSDGTLDPECTWKANWSRLTAADNSDVSGGHYKSPALCVSTWEQASGQSRAGWLAVSVDQNEKYQVLAFSGNVAPNRSASWSQYGATKRWASKPTCAIRETAAWTDDTPVGGFLIAGKVKGNTNPPSNDPNHNKIFVSAGRFAPWYPSFPNPQIWQNPTYVTGFAAVSNDAYSTGGLPALGSTGLSSSFGDPAVVLVFMDDAQDTIYAHTHALPYLNGSGAVDGPWSAKIEGPTLPCDSNGCWKAQGTPAIAREAVTFRIVVHATRTVSGVTSHRLYETHFYSDGSGGYFSQYNGSPGAFWTHRTLPGVNEATPWIDGDPFITADPGEGHLTLYFRQGSTIMQTTFTYPGATHAPTPVHAGINERTFVGSPAAVAGVGFDMGSHVALALEDNKGLYFIDSDGDIIP